MSETTPTSVSHAVTRTALIASLNEDLSREYQAIIGYVTYSQVLKGAAYMHVARELEKHAAEELSHAITIARQIDYLGGTPTVVAQSVHQSTDAETMLRADLANEVETIRQYRRRVVECESLGEFAISEQLREILTQEQDHLIELATALGTEVPNPGMA